MNKIIITSIVTLGTAIGMLPLLILFFRDPVKNKTSLIEAVKPFIWLLFIGSIYEIVFTVGLHVWTAPWFHYYYLAEYIVLCYFFKKVLVGKYTRLLTVFAVLYIALWIGFTIFWFEFNDDFDDIYLGSFETILVYTFVILWVKKVFKETEIDSLWRMPVFYFIAGFILYFIGAFFVNLLISELFRATGEGSKYWMVSVLLNIAMRVLTIVGVWKATQKRKIFIVKKFS